MDILLKRPYCYYMPFTQTESKGYVSAVEASKQFGYTNDYVARLAREKKVVGVQEGRQWFVDIRSLEGFVRKTNEAKKEQAARVRKERQKERASHKKLEKIQVAQGISVIAAQPLLNVPPRAGTLAKAGLLLSLGVLTGSAFFNLMLGGGMQMVSTANVMDALHTWTSRFSVVSGSPEVQQRHTLESITPMVSARETPGPAEKGIVVLSPEDTTSESEVQASFSDETEVVFDEGGGSGLIKPIFKSGAGSAYRFLLVPLRNEE